MQYARFTCVLRRLERLAVLSNPSSFQVKLLIEHGADPNATACDGCTALHYAAREDCTEAAQVLLQARPRRRERRCPAPDRGSPLSRPRLRAMPAGFAQHGARPDIRNSAGRAPVDEIYDETSDDGSRLFRLLMRERRPLIWRSLIRSMP